MSVDRYGLEAVFSFEERGNPAARMRVIEQGLQSIEIAVERTYQAVKGSSIGQAITQALQGADRAVEQTRQGFHNLQESAKGTGAQTARSMQQTSQAARSAVSALAPLKGQFAALKAEARNIDFGDLGNPQQFNQAKTALNQYVQELEKLETQITGTTAADRQMRAELATARNAAESKIETATNSRRLEVAQGRSQIATGVAGAATAVALPTVGLGVNAVKLTSGFDDQLAQVEAALNEGDRTQANLQQIRDTAKNLGATTRFSASEAAAGFVLLAQAGEPVENQLKEIAGTLKLAAAGNLSIAQATEFTVSALGQFQLKAENANHVSDVMAAAAAAGQIEVGDLGMTLKYTGTVANTYGASIEQVSAMTAQLSKAGIKGSEAGTALRSMFLNLAAGSGPAKDALMRLGVSVADSSGKLRPINQVMQDIGSSMNGLSDPEKMGILRDIFGSEAIGAAKFLMQDVKAWEDTTAALFKASEGAGAAATQAKIMESKIGGSFRNLSSAAEGVLIEIGEVLIPIVKVGVDALSNLLGAFIALPKPVKTIIVALGSVVAVTATVAAIAAGAMAAWFAFQGAIIAAGLEVSALGVILGPFAGLVTPLITAFGTGGLAGVFGVLGSSIAGVGSTIATFAGGALAAITSPIGLAVGGILLLYAAVEYLTPGFNVLGAVLSVFSGALGFAWGLIRGVAQGILTGLTPAITAFRTVFAPVGGMFTSTFGGFAPAIAQAAQWFTRLSGAGEIVGQAIGAALTAPFWLLGRTVTAVTLLLQGKWGEFAQYVVDTFMAIPRAVSGVLGKLTPPWMKKEEASQAKSTDKAQPNPPAKPSATETPATATVKPEIPKPVFVPATPAEAAFFAQTPILPSPVTPNVTPVTSYIAPVTTLPGRNNILPIDRSSNPEAIAGQSVQPMQPTAPTIIPASTPTATAIAAKPQILQTVNPAIGQTVEAGVQPTPAAQVAQAAIAPIAAQPVSLPDVKIANVLPLPLNVPVQMQPVLQAVGNVDLAAVQSRIGQAVTSAATTLEASYRAKVEQIALEPVSFSALIAVDAAPISAAFEQVKSAAATLATDTASALTRLDFTSITQSAQTFGSIATAAAQTVAQHIGSMTLSAIAFGVTSLMGLSPALLILGGMAIAVLAVSMNFLGLRTILGGVIQTLGGIISAVFSAARGSIQVIRGILQVFLGIGAALRGDFSQIKAGFSLAFEGIHTIAHGIAQGIAQTFHGLTQILQGGFTAIAQIGKSTFAVIGLAVNTPIAAFRLMGQAVETAAHLIDQAFGAAASFLQKLFGSLGQIASQTFGGIGDSGRFASQVLTSLLDAPTAAWRSFLGFIDTVQAKLQGLMNAATNLPATATAAVKSKVGGLFGMGRNRAASSATPASTPSDPLEVSTASTASTASVVPVAPATPAIFKPQPQITGQIAAPQIILPATPQPTALKNHPSIFSTPDPVSPVAPSLDLTFPAATRTSPILPQPISQAAIAPTAPAPIAPVNSAANLALQRLDEAEAHLAAKQQHVITSTGQTVGALGMALSNLAPAAAAPLLTVAGLFDSVDSLSAALPNLRSSFAAAVPMLQNFGASSSRMWMALRSGNLGAVSQSFSSLRSVVGSSVAAMASSVAAIVTGNAGAAISFAGLQSAAVTAYSTMLAPMLPFIAIGAGVVGAIVLLRVAFQKNFLGIRTVIMGAVGAIRAVVGAVGWLVRTVISAAGFLLKFAIAFSPIGLALFGIRAAASLTGAVIQAVVGRIGSALQAVGKGFLAPFTPLISAFQSIGRFLSSTFQSVNRLANTLLGVKQAGTPVTQSFQQIAQSITAPLQLLTSLGFAIGMLLNPIGLVSLAIRGIVFAIEGIISAVVRLANIAATTLLAPFQALAGLGGRITGLFDRSSSPQNSQPQNELSNPASSAARSIPVSAAAIPVATTPIAIAAIPTSATPTTPAQVAPVLPATPVSTVSASIEVADTTPQIQGAWQSFHGWFGNAMGGLVGAGQDAGVGLINALNHNPTVKIPIAWMNALSQIRSGLHSFLDVASSSGSTIAGVFQSVAGVAQTVLGAAMNTALTFSVSSLIAFAPLLAVLGGIGLAAIALSANFLGLKTIVGGLFGIVKGLYQAFSATVQGIVQLLQGVGQVIGGIFAAVRGDFTQMQAGLQTVFAGFTQIFSGLAQGVRTALDGVMQIAKGALQGLEQLFGAVRLILDVSGLSRATEAIGGILDGVGQAVRSSLGSAVETAQNLLQAGVNQIAQQWKGLQAAVDNVPILREFRAFAEGLPAMFAGVVERIQALWSGLGNAVGGVFNRLTGKAKQSGQQLVSNLAENSPGPTFQIRQRWIVLTEVISGRLDGLRSHSAAVGSRISASLSGEGIRQGVGKLGNSFGSLGSVVSNFAPNLAAPLFMVGDLANSFESLVDFAPQAQQFFGRIAGSSTGFSQVFARLGGVIPTIVGVMGTAFTSLAGIAATAWSAILAPALPFIAIGAAIVGAIVLVGVAFQKNFLGIRSAISAIANLAQGLLSGLMTGVGLIGSALGLILNPLGLILNAFQAVASIVRMIVDGIAQAVSAVAGLGSSFANFSLPNLNPLNAISSLGSLFNRPAKTPEANFQAVSSAAIVPDSAATSATSASTAANLASSSAQPITSPITSPIADPMITPIANSTAQIQSAWSGFAGWFGGAMGGLVGAGENAGMGLINALNHNPTVKIPLAWERATGFIRGLFGGWINTALNIGKTLVDVFVSAVGTIAQAFGSMNFTLLSFGISTALSLAPVLLTLGAIGAGIHLVSRNFLGLRTIAESVMGAITGVLEGLAQTIRGVAQVLSGSFDFALALIRGDFEGMKAAVGQVFEGIKQVFRGAAQVLQSVWQGAVGVVEGAFQGLAQIGRQVGGSLGQVLTAPTQLWQGFLNVLEQIEQRLRAVGNAIANSPVGRFVSSAQKVVTGRAANLQQAGDMTDFDARLAAAPDRNVAGQAQAQAQAQPKPSIVQRMFGKRSPQEIQNVAASSVSSTAPASVSVSAPTSTAVAPLDTPVAMPIGATPGVSAPLRPTDSSIPAQNPAVAQAVAPVQLTTPRSQNIPPQFSEQIQPFTPLQAESPGMTSIGTATGDSRSAAVEPSSSAIERGLGQAGGRATESMGAATEAVGSLSMVIGTIAPGLAAPIEGFSLLMTGITGLMTSVPMLSGLIAGSKAAQTASNAALASSNLAVAGSNQAVSATTLQSAVAAARSAATKAAIVGWNGLISASNFAMAASTRIITALTNQSARALIWSNVVKAASIAWSGLMAVANAVLSVSFAGVGIAAAAAWSAVLAPIAPILIAVGAIAGAIALVYVAFRSNFLGIGSLVQGVFAAIGSTIKIAGEVIWEIVSQPIAAFREGLRAIGLAFGAVGSVFQMAFAPLANLFGSSSAQAVNFSNVIRTAFQVAFLPLRVVFFAISLALKAVMFSIAGTIRGFALLAAIILLPVRIIGSLINILGFLGKAFISNFLAPFQLIGSTVQSVFSAISGIFSAIGNLAAMPAQAIMGLLQAIRNGLTSLPIIGGLFAAALGGGKGQGQSQGQSQSQAAAPALAPAAPVQRFAGGGLVKGSGGTDSQQALVTPGEFVMTPGATAMFYPMLEAMNAGQGMAALLSLLPSIPSIAPPPALLQFAGAAVGMNAGGMSSPTPSGDRPVKIELNIANINVGGAGGSAGANQASPQALAMEMIEQLMPHLERAVVNLLRDQVDKSR